MKGGREFSIHNSIFLIAVPGEVSERLKEHAWKACVVNATAGSNPALSATKNNYKLIILNYKLKNRIKNIK